MSKGKKTFLFALIRAFILILLARTSVDLLAAALQKTLPDKTGIKAVSGILALALVGLAVFAVSRLARVRLSALPVFVDKKEKLLYFAATVAVATLLLAIPVTTRDFSPAFLLSLLYGVIVLPAFEEILFRGLVWNSLRPHFKVELTVCMVTAALFAVWQTGFIGIILAGERIPAADLVMVIASKAVLGLMVGLITGFARLKAKNCYPGILLHTILSIAIR